MSRIKTMETIEDILHVDIPYQNLSEQEIMILLIIVNSKSSSSCSRKEARHILESYKNKTKWRNKI